MSRVNIDSMVWTDPRFKLLAHLAGWSGRHEAIGRMAELWNYCTDAEAEVVSASLVASLLELDQGEAGHILVQSELADWEGDDPINGETLRIRGCRGRTDWLSAKRKAGAKGGKRSGLTRAQARDEAKPQSASTKTKQTSSTTSRKSNPPAPAPAPADSPDSAGASSPAATKKSKPKTKPVAGYQEFVASFSAAYELANQAKPTWGAKQGSQVKDLLKKHGLDECLRRMEIMFTAPPSFLTPPFDLGTLQGNFDRLSQPSRPASKTGGLTAQQLWNGELT